VCMAVAQAVAGAKRVAKSDRKTLKGKRGRTRGKFGVESAARRSSSARSLRGCFARSGRQRAADRADRRGHEDPTAVLKLPILKASGGEEDQDDWDEESNAVLRAVASVSHHDRDRDGGRVMTAPGPASATAVAPSQARDRPMPLTSPLASKAAVTSIVSTAADCRRNLVDAPPLTRRTTGTSPTLRAAEPGRSPEDSTSRRRRAPRARAEMQKGQKGGKSRSPGSGGGRMRNKAHPQPHRSARRRRGEPTATADRGWPRFSRYGPGCGWQ